MSWIFIKYLAQHILSLLLFPVHLTALPKYYFYSVTMLISEYASVNNRKKKAPSR